MTAIQKLTHDQKLERWKAALKALDMNPRQIAARMRKTAAMCYAWNCGSAGIPEKRLEQVEAWVEAMQK